jgi:hypothetical protein
MGVVAQCPKVGEDLCRRASSAPSAAGLIALVDHDCCGRRNRGSAVACIRRFAIVLLNTSLFQRFSIFVDAPCQDLKVLCHTRI